MGILKSMDTVCGNMHIFMHVQNVIALRGFTDPHQSIRGEEMEMYSSKIRLLEEVYLRRMFETSLCYLRSSYVRTACGSKGNISVVAVLKLWYKKG